MIVEVKWHNTEQIMLQRWANYKSPIARNGVFITINNECILLYCKSISAHPLTPIYHYKVVLLQEFDTTVFHIKLPIYVEFVDRFSNGHFIFSKSRSFHGESSTAYIVTSTGEISNQIQLGDGIVNLQIDDFDLIWVAYSQEGIEGRLGWTANQAIGRDGVVVFDQQGQPVWTAQELNLKNCYALNISKTDYQFFASCESPLIHSFKQQKYCSYEIDQQPFKQFICGLENSLIVVDGNRRLMRLLKDGYSYVQGQKIELIDQQKNVLHGELVLRNEAIYCLVDDVIYRQLYA